MRSGEFLPCMDFTFSQVPWGSITAHLVSVDVAHNVNGGRPRDTVELFDFGLERGRAERFPLRRNFKEQHLSDIPHIRRAGGLLSFPPIIHFAPLQISPFYLSARGGLDK